MSLEQLRLRICAAFALTSWFVIAGCTETPPDHVSNWHYYTKDGEVIDDITHTKWLWGSRMQNTRGLSSPHKTTDTIGLGDACWAERTGSATATNKNNPTITVPVEVAGAKGIDSAAITIAHEFRHIWVYQQWGARINQTGTVGSHHHNDTDAIPDDVETDRSVGSLGAQYEFSDTDPDTFGLASVFPGSNYGVYGDNEILARVEGFNYPRTTYPQRDWSKGGKQWNH